MVVPAALKVVRLKPTRKVSSLVLLSDSLGTWVSCGVCPPGPKTGR